MRGKDGKGLEMASGSGVTAFIPTFNRADYLKEALLSLLKQTLRPDEIIVIDDGSTDNTAQVVAPFGSQVVYVRKANGGKSSALNAGLQRSSNELIYILDDDDVAAPDAIERLVEALKSNPECGFAYAGHDVFWVTDSGKVKTETREPHPPDDDALSLALMHQCLLYQSNMLVRKKCYEQVGPFNEAFIRSQDYEMLLRLVRQFRGKRVDGIVFHQRKHTGVRGTSSLQIKRSNSATVQGSFDQKIFKAVYSNYALEEFLPGSHASLSSHDQITALLERCVIVGRRELWTLAAQDLREIAAIASQAQIHGLTLEQSHILQRMFDASSAGLWNFAAAGEFRAAVAAIPDPALAKQIRAALGAPFTGHRRNSMKHKKFKSAAYLTACSMYFSPSGGRLAHYLGNLALELSHRRHEANAAPSGSIPSSSSDRR